MTINLFHAGPAMHAASIRRYTVTVEIRAPEFSHTLHVQDQVSADAGIEAAKRIVGNVWPNLKDAEFKVLACA